MDKLEDLGRRLDAELTRLLQLGCAANRTIADRRQPPPARPSPPPESTSESAKRETETPPAPSPAAPAKRHKTPPLSAPVGYTEEGNASWYGNPFHGRRASNGEVYDMYKFTAAHRTLPFETMVRAIGRAHV